MEFTQKELEQTIQNYTVSISPLVLKQFPVKEKRKYMLLTIIAPCFDAVKQYTESEVNDLLKPIYHDFATLRRYLIDYGFLTRTPDCKTYWVIKA